MTSVTIQRDEKFPHLSKAPIMEAIVELRARAGSGWEKESAIAGVKAELSEYPKLQATHSSELCFELNPQAPASAQAHPVPTPALSWNGVVAQSADSRQIGRFDRDFFAYNRLAPYGDWNEFLAEALRLWATHRKLAKPAEIQRVGLRFINRIEVPGDALILDQILTAPPQAIPGLSLPLAGFIQSDSWQVPGHPYTVMVNRTLQPPTGIGGNFGVIIDIDISFGHCPEDQLMESLTEMRWLKNKVFFGSLTPQALEKLK